MKRLSLFFMVLSFTGNLFAQKEQTLTISANAIEGFSGEAVTTAQGIVLDAETKDSLFSMKRNIGMTWKGNEEPRKIVTLSCQIPKKPGKYLIKAFANGYDTIYQELDINKIGNREFTRSLPAFVFYPKAKDLNELSVTATKVKFYVKGDTIVYNADAFNIAEGSMLHVLIKQLPGVELKDGGEIYVNGKYIESLLLNGKDFFQGNKNIMLNNLGAYTVKEIEVYNKWSDRSLLAGQNLGDDSYVMDVKLKKEYLSGFVGNIEAGGGTKERYLGRLFGMWYTSRSRVALVGNINNLNDQRTPGQNDSWQRTQTPGDFRTKMIGVDYNFSPRADDNLWNFSGNTNINHIRDNNINSTYIKNFLPVGDTYQTMYGKSHSHNLDFSTRNFFRWNPKKMSLLLSQNFAYKKNDMESQRLSGTFQEEIKNMTEHLLNQIYSGEVSSFKDITINSSLTQSLMTGSSINAVGSASSSFKFSHSPDLLNFNISGGYNENRSNNFDCYGINYNKEVTNTRLYQYIKNRPDKNWNISGLTGYTYVFAEKRSAEFSISYKHTDITKDSYLYDLDRLEDAEVFGVLPPNYLTGLNMDQTYLSREKDDKIQLYINIHKLSDNSNQKGISFQIIPIITYNHRKLHYIQGLQDEKVRKNTIDIQFLNTFITYQFSNNSFKLLYERNVDLAPLNRMIDIIDNRNPLNIYLGASDLKNSFKNSLWFTWTKNLSTQKPSKHSWYNLMHLKWTFFENALTNGYSLDRESGVRAYKMFNVNGNYWLSWWDNFYHDFGPRNQFTISSATRVYYIKESDMMASDGMNFMKTSIDNWTLGQTIDLKWRIGKQQIGVNGDITWRRTLGIDAGFNNFSALNGQYGVSGIFTLPANFNLSTDLNIYTRSGYTESYLNRSDVVWNARLSYGAKGGKWLFMLDGFDLLHQLTNITYNVNAVGRTETYINVLPNYLLFHIQYRFMIQPKKRN